MYKGFTALTYNTGNTRFYVSYFTKFKESNYAQVILETPFEASNNTTKDEFTRFARACIKDSLSQGDAPLAFHLLYTQKGILDYTHSNEYLQATRAKLSWCKAAEASVIYTNYGLSGEMLDTIDLMAKQNIEVIYRELPNFEIIPEFKIENAQTTPLLERLTSIFNSSSLPTRAIIESPFAGKTQEEFIDNIRYARACVEHALNQNLAPIASHLLYTQKDILNDNIPEERNWGIEAGVVWYKQAEASAIFVDRGISRGMQYGIKRATEQENTQVLEDQKIPLFNPQHFGKNSEIKKNFIIS